MPDYYSILWRTLKTGDFDSPQWRNSVFDRTRQVLLDQLRARRPRLSNTEIKLQTDALNAAIRTIQSEFAQTGSQSRAPREASYDSRPLRRERLAGEAVTAGDRATPLQLNRLVLAGIAVVVAGNRCRRLRVCADTSRQRASARDKKGNRRETNGTGRKQPAKRIGGRRRRPCTRRRRRLDGR